MCMRCMTKKFHKNIILLLSLALCYYLKSTNFDTFSYLIRQYDHLLSPFQVVALFLERLNAHLLKPLSCIAQH